MSIQLASCLSAAGAVRYKNVSVLAAIGVDRDGFRRMLGVAEGHRRTRPVGWDFSST